MRIYAEALEIAPEDVIPEFLRLDATDRDFDTVLTDLRAMLHPAKKYSLRKHFCNHDTNKGCFAEPVG